MSGSILKFDHDPLAQGSQTAVDELRLRLKAWVEQAVSLCLAKVTQPSSKLIQGDSLALQRKPKRRLEGQACFRLDQAPVPGRARLRDRLSPTKAVSDHFLKTVASVHKCFRHIPAIRYGAAPIREFDQEATSLVRRHGSNLDRISEAHPSSLQVAAAQAEATQDRLQRARRKIAAFGLGHRYVHRAVPDRPMPALTARGDHIEGYPAFARKTAQPSDQFVTRHIASARSSFAS